MPFLHPTDSGRPVSARRVAELLLDPAFERDGISILGGEPFMQAEGPLALVRELRAMGCSHIVCYSGYTYEALQRRAAKEPAIAAILADIDVLIDGPYVEALEASAGPWTGPGNPRVLDLAATRGGPEKFARHEMEELPLPANRAGGLVDRGRMMTAPGRAHETDGDPSSRSE